MCGLFLTGPESRSVFKEARSLEVLTPGGYFKTRKRPNFKTKILADAKAPPVNPWAYISWYPKLDPREGR